MIHTCQLPGKEIDFAPDIARHSGDRTVVYKEVNGQKLLLSLYEPPRYGQQDSYPLWVFVHGGGWQGRKVFGDQADWAGDYLGFLARRYAQEGYLCASVDYRLLREEGRAAGYELIDLCQDCADAVAWLKAHAGELRIDLSRTRVLGESAGGYLAAALITLPLCDRAFFRSAVLVNAITDLSDPRWGRYLAPDSAHPLLKGLSAEEKIALLSPVRHIARETCPTLLLHGAQDSVVYPFHSAEFHDLMTECGAQAELDYIEDTNHAFLLAEYMRERRSSLQAASAAVARIDEWRGGEGVCAAHAAGNE